MTNLTILSLVMLLVAACTAGSSGSSPSAVAAQKAAAKCDEEADEIRRIDYCTQAIESGWLSPKTLSHALVIRALAYKNKSPSETDRALADVEAAISLDRENSYAYRTRGILTWQKDDWQDAMADLDTAVRLEPDEAYHYLIRGNFNLLLDRLSEANRDYEVAVSLDPTLEVLVQGIRMAHSLARQGSPRESSPIVGCVRPDGSTITTTAYACQSIGGTVSK